VNGQSVPVTSFRKYCISISQNARKHKGTVFVPAGLWTVGSLYLSSNTNLYLAPGAVVRFTGEASHCKVDGHKESQRRDLTWFISTGPNAKNISITGRGTIDGDGRASLKASNLVMRVSGGPICRYGSHLLRILFGFYCLVTDGG
jgi:polygalacturonase